MCRSFVNGAIEAAAVDVAIGVAVAIVTGM